MRVLIVDDEPLARERIRTLLRRDPAIEIAGEAEDGVSAVEAIESQSPDLVFLDVQMAGMTGFEVVAAVGAERMPLVVFVTAYDEFALRAFEAHAIGYLVKPFAPERLLAAVDRAKTQLRGRSRDEFESDLRALVSTATTVEYLDRIMVKRGPRFVFLRTADIHWIEAADNYVQLHTAAGSELLRATLNTLESRLDPRRFVRVHRGAIVNLEFLEGMESWGQGEYLLSLPAGKHLTSSRSYRTRLREALGGSLSAD